VSELAWLVLVFATAVSGCGSGATAPHASGPGIPRTLIREARPIGRGPRFLPPVRGRVGRPCRSGLARRYGVHLEVFAVNRVVLVPAGIGVRGPVHRSAARISAARCYGPLVTLEPTGVILVSPGRDHLVRDLFRAWGQPLSRARIASFRAAPGTRVRAFVDGRSWPGSPGSIPLRRHAEIVLEVGPSVPPHHAYTFPPET
jgi:hypothetical protein